MFLRRRTGNVLGLIDGLAEGILCLVRELVLLVELSGLDDSLLYELTDDTEGGHTVANKVVLVVDFLDLILGVGKSTLDLADDLGVDRSLAGLDLFEGFFQ